jgi:hypothetical protein
MTKSINLLGVRINELQLNTTTTICKSIDINVQPSILSPRNIEPKTVPSPINITVAQQIEYKQA